MSPVEGAVYYRFIIDDWWYLSYYQSSYSQETSVTIPSGILKPNNVYSWRVEVFDGSTHSGSKNRSRGPVRSFFVKESYGKYALNISTTGQGSVTANPSDGPYDVGTDIHLTATPETGWEFDSWSGDLTGSDNPTTITMTKDMNITAIFTVSQVSTYTLTVNTEGPGTVTLNPSGGTYNEGQEITLTAAASESGWVFDTWSGNLAGSVNPETITMNSNKTVTAIFESETGEVGKDGVSDGEEWGPDPSTPLDGNDDNTPDYQQDNVTSVKTSDEQEYVTIVVEDTMTIADVVVMDNPSKQQDLPEPEEEKETLTFPYGFFSFTIEDVGLNGSVDVILYLPEGETANTYYKYGPEPGKVWDHWYEFLYDNETGAEFSSNAITLHFTDALRGDDEVGAPDGIIVDDGGPAILTKTDPDDGGGGGGGGWPTTITETETNEGCFLDILGI